MQVHHGALSAYEGHCWKEALKLGHQWPIN